MSNLTSEPSEPDDSLPYISKSRLKTYTQCPRKFWYTYWCGVRAPDNYYFKRGRQVHEAFEVFHERVIELGDFPPSLHSLFHGANMQWADYYASFMAFERRRWKECRDFDTWLPAEIEVEGWLGAPPESWVEENGEPDYVSADIPSGSIPWMGRADVVLNTQSVPGVDGDGVVIVDYKTGKTPDEKYRDEGIYLEGEYYAMLFEEFYNVDAVAGYYPGDDELIVSPLSEERRELIMSNVARMQWTNDKERFPIEEQPLCCYKSGECHFYEVCDSRWGTPGGPGPTYVNSMKQRSSGGPA